MALATASTSYNEAKESAQAIRKQLPSILQNPKIGVICGSGLGGLQHSVVEATGAPRIEVKYKDVPGMSEPSGM